MDDGRNNRTDRKMKNRNEKEYKDIQRQVQKKIQEAKENWIEEKCYKLEELERKHDDFDVHKKIKELTSAKNVLIF